MKIDEIKAKVASNEYDFLRENEHLGSRLILLGLGGSHSYGTNNADSDLDVRGCALNTKSEILTNENFEQFVNEETDTVIYSFNKLISLLSNVNPNTIELLGLKPEHYLYVSPVVRNYWIIRSCSYPKRRYIHLAGMQISSFIDCNRNQQVK